MVRMADGTQVFRDACKRIQELEQQCATLAAEIDRMRPVVEVTVREIRRDDDRFSWSDLKDAVDTYEASQPK